MRSCDHTEEYLNFPNLIPVLNYFYNSRTSKHWYDFSVVLSILLWDPDVSGRLASSYLWVECSSGSLQAHPPLRHSSRTSVHNCPLTVGIRTSSSIRRRLPRNCTANGKVRPRDPCAKFDEGGHYQNRCLRGRCISMRYVLRLTAGIRTGRCHGYLDEQAP